MRAEPTGQYPLLSIVVPVAPGDDAWIELLPLLSDAPAGTEIILSATTDLSEAPELRSPTLQHLNISCLESSRGRAHQMNRAALMATGNFLWFLHSDSRFDRHALGVLTGHLKNSPECFFHFKLKFIRSRRIPTALNAHGANLRSRFLKMPFGDQGFCLSRELFFRLGKYDEMAPYGEDHLLAWAARHARIPIVELPAFIATSARKYETKGWAQTTLKHVWLTARQATPQFIRLFRGSM